jgi:hypothetical protein
MTFRTHLNQLWHAISRGGKAGRSARPRRPRFRPALESLECRLTPTTDVWTGANQAVDLNWSDPANWSLGRTPQPSDIVDFTGGVTTSIVDAPFTIAGLTAIRHFSTVLEVNASLTITGDLTFDFQGGGTIYCDGAVTVDGTGSTWSSGGDLSLGAGGLTNNGTLTIDTGAGGVYAVGTGTLTNNGTIHEIGTNYLHFQSQITFGATGTLNNVGLYDFGTDCGLTNGTLINSGTGTVGKSGGSGTSLFNLDGFQNIGGTIQATSGTLALGGRTALVDGATLQAGSAATLDLTGGALVQYGGTITGSGLGTITCGTGLVQIAPKGATFNMQSPGLFQWGGGTIDVSLGSLTNDSTSTLNLDTTVSSGLLTGAGTLTNLGTINETGGRWLILDTGTTLSNKKTYNLKSDGGITGGTFSNSGTLKKAAGTGTSQINSTLNNTGTLQVSSGTVHVTGTVTQISGGVLGAGKWTVSVGGSTHGTLTIDTGFTTIGSHAAVTLNGTNASFTNLSSLASIQSGGSLLLEGKASLTTSGSLTNSGKLTVDAGSTLTVSGTFTQTSTATLTVQIKVSGSTTTVGQIVTAAGGGGASLGGKLALTVSGLPALNTPFTIVDDLSATPITGMFANLPEGAKLTVGGHQYQIHYGSTAVTLTRIS